MERGSLGVALVQRQVMLVQAVRSHTQHDRWLDVHTYAPFGDRVFLATDTLHARISSSDVLTIFPTSDIVRNLDTGMLELPHKACSEFNELTARNLSRKESLWSSCTAKLR